jgi:hypothetical protein
MNVYEKALELLGEEGENWISGEYEDRGRYCLVGALNLARNGNAWNGVSSDFVSVMTVVREQFYTDPYEFESIEDWNDQNLRTFDDVRAVLEKAAIKEEEFGAED